MKKKIIIFTIIIVIILLTIPSMNAIKINKIRDARNEIKNNLEINTLKINEFKEKQKNIKTFFESGEFSLNNLLSFLRVLIGYILLIPSFMLIIVFAWWIIPILIVYFTTEDIEDKEKLLNYFKSACMIMIPFIANVIVIANEGKISFMLAWSTLLVYFTKFPDELPPALQIDNSF